MKQCVRLVLAALALILGACSSPPIHRYTLLAPSYSGAASDKPVPFLIDVLPIDLPVQLDQPQFVVRQGASGVAILEGERWAGPLGDELRQALSAGLMSRLGTRDIAGLVKPANQPVLHIKLLVRRLDAWPGQKLELDADWSLSMSDAPDKSRLFCHGRFDEPATGSYAELAQAGQRAMSALATRIAADARGWVLSHQAECPG
ncbi:MAG: PqiC family protein [Azonexus sp.]